MTQYTKTAALLFGARPNYMKIAPLWRALRDKAPEAEPVLIHTGQHYDKNLSDVFFEDLGMPRPDICLNVGSGSHAEQTGKVMMKLEPVLMDRRPNVLVVAGDVNSTLAGALVAVKMGIPVAHLEAGLRSFDRAMPEEINRIATDTISDVLFTSCLDADRNLTAEGVPAGKIRFVGNIMIDSLVSVLPKASSSGILAQLGLNRGKYACTTLHRPSNVDDPKTLSGILDGLADISADMPVVFAVHPRTQKTLNTMKWPQPGANIVILGPTRYLDFLWLMSNAAVAITDSGGIQEETSFLGIPCITVRENTERPVTITHGTNRLAPPSRQSIRTAFSEALTTDYPRNCKIDLWDGKTAHRVLDVLRDLFL